jgi:hypothetical protein
VNRLAASIKMITKKFILNNNIMKTTKTFLAILFLAVSYTISYSQPVLDWADIYDRGTGDSEYTLDTKADGLGYVYATGITDSSSGNVNIVTIKYRPDGTKEWTRHYDFGGLNDRASFISIDPSGFVYVTGTVQISSSNRDILVLKYKPNGTLLWANRYMVTGYTGVGNDEPTGAVYSSNSLYVCGYISEDASSLKRQIAVFRISASGTYISTGIGSAGIDDVPNSMSVDLSGNVYLAGYTGNSPFNGLALKLNISLGLLWAKIIKDTVRTNSTLYGVKINSSGRVNFVGRAHNSLVTSNPTGTALQMNQADGSVIWYKRFLPSGSVSVSPYYMTIDNADNVIIGGYYTTPSVKSLVVKYNSAGVFKWSKSLDSMSHVRAITCDPSGNIYPAGAPLYNKCFAKLDGEGNIIWYGANSNAQIYSIVFGGIANIYLGGVHKVTSGNNNLLTAKYTIPPGSSRPVSIESEESRTFKLHDNFPNPFNPSTSIKFSVPATGLVSLKVFDITGKEVTTLVDGNIEQGEHEVNFNASHLASGVYFYKLISGSFTEVKKMILVK